MVRLFEKASDKRKQTKKHRQLYSGFFIASKRVVIELDGSQHFQPENKKSDITRDADLEALGIKVLRYKNADVNKNFNGICKDILRNIDIREDQLKK